ncbi:unnamed protein product [Urochloa decumbens]|uniref:Alpha/beta hydrolase fold-3 domain-containing protein n=1 Tax=Urochloa decumbens TaxID=240449 RepID=A0ABC8VU29_9POAL
MKDRASRQPSLPYVVEDCLGLLQVLSDGTVLRFSPPPFPAGAAYDDGRVEWQDAVYDAGNNLGVRMYRPTTRSGAGAAAEHTKKKKLLPVLVYFPGGGFCFGSYSYPKNHALCLRFAAELPAVVCSFDHRLPAAFEDAMAALLWLPGQVLRSPWLAGRADPGRVFVSGTSSGACIAHQMAARFGTTGLRPLEIAGYILLMPYFLSEEATPSELSTPETALLSRERSDMYVRLAMPAEWNKDHPLVNPFGPYSSSLALAAADVGRVLVVAAECDLVRDKNLEYAQRIKALGKDVRLALFPGQEHAFCANKPLSAAADEVIRLMKRFIL